MGSVEAHCTQDIATGKLEAEINSGAEIICSFKISVERLSSFIVDVIFSLMMRKVLGRHFFYLIKLEHLLSARVVTSGF